MVNYVAIVVAAVAGFAFGAVWYMALGKVWMAALGMTEHPKPQPAPFLIAFAAQLVMAWMLAGALGHLGDVSVVAGLITAALIWVGFIATTLVVNHRFQGAKWSLTLIDGGHWLGVLLVMGVVLGLFGA
jgi:hypothetical protein